MKTSTILRRAEKYLWDGHGDIRAHQFPILCNAIRIVPGTPSGKVDAVCREITRRIGRRLTYTRWALDRGHLRSDWDDSDWPLIQANRLNWLRELQREYREKGD